MTDPRIDELTTMCHEALKRGDETVAVPVNELLILIAKAFMQRFPIVIEAPPTIPLEFETVFVTGGDAVIWDYRDRFPSGGAEPPREGA